MKPPLSVISMRKRLDVTLAVVALVIVASAIVFGVQIHTIPFDSDAWRAGDAKLRFRMKDSLTAKHAAGAFPTREVVARLLGPDDQESGTPGYNHYRLMEWYGNPWYLRIEFDYQGNVILFSAHPD